jgi:hypothetical protein
VPHCGQPSRSSILGQEYESIAVLADGGSVCLYVFWDRTQDRARKYSGAAVCPLFESLDRSRMAGLNFSDSDLPIQLHFALFNGSAGFVLKPQAMLTTSRESSTLHDTMLMRCASCSSRCTDASATPSPRKRKYEAYFPLTGDWLRCTTITVLSLHHCPKVKMGPVLFPHCLLAHSHRATNALKLAVALRRPSRLFVSFRM